MADAFSQNIAIFRGADVDIQFSGAAADFSESPVSWALQFSIAKNRGQTPVLTITTPTITVTGTGPYICHVPITRAQAAALLRDEYDFDLFRTDSGSVTPKANGSLKVLTPVYPLPAAV